MAPAQTVFGIKIKTPAISSKTPMITLPLGSKPVFLKI